MTGNSEKIPLLELAPKEMEELAASWGYPEYRGRQLYNWIFAHQCEDLQLMSDLPSSFRVCLQERTILVLPVIEQVLTARDGTRKFLVRMADGIKVEMVAIPHDRGALTSYTLCISSQAGCPLGCAFCATGASGFKRNLQAAEIAGQVLRARQSLQVLLSPLDLEQGRLVSNIVLMGMGEPLLNYDSSIKAVKIINEAKGINIGQRHITISTAGMVPGIYRLAGENLQITLAVSLHAADDAKRDRLVPLNRKYPLGELMKAIDEYILQTGRRVSLEYVMLKGVNISREDAGRLAALARGRLVNINLIPFNATAQGAFRAPGRNEVLAFQRWLSASGVDVTVRKEHGADIDAACGQLAMRTDD